MIIGIVETRIHIQQVSQLIQSQPSSVRLFWPVPGLPTLLACTVPPTLPVEGSPVPPGAKHWASHQLDGRQGQHSPVWLDQLGLLINEQLTRRIGKKNIPWPVDPGDNVLAHDLKTLRALCLVHGFISILQLSKLFIWFRVFLHTHRRWLGILYNANKKNPNNQL